MDDFVPMGMPVCWHRRCPARHGSTTDHQPYLMQDTRLCPESHTITTDIASLLFAERVLDQQDWRRDSMGRGGVK